ncbi:MAG TPA: SH3 domain-containing protein [Bacillota bacterium]|nr:SH3 domain-containing protein [Bacillota bacterium]
MKKWISGVLALVLVLTLFTPIMLPSYAEGVAKESGKVNYPAVHLRESPWGEIVDLIYDGASVEVLGSKKDSDGNIWYEVNVSDKRGYMFAEYIDLDKAPATDSQLNGSVKVTWDFARVRTSPWGSVLGQLSRGQSADVTGQTKDSDGATWYKVKFGGKEGYMHEENVSFSSAPAATPPETQKPSIKEDSLKGSLKVTWNFARVRTSPWGTVLGQLNRGDTAEVTGQTKDSDGATWYKVKFSGKDGYMHEDNVSFTAGKAPEEVKPPASSDVKGSLKVTWNFARVRTSPWGSILGQLNRNETAEVTGQTKDDSGDIWYKVKFSGKDGYMHEDNVSFTAGKAPEEVKPPASSETKGSLKVTWNFARVRTSPWGTILGQLNRNETAEVTGQTKDSSGDTWYKVKYSGRDGYMHEDNVSFTAGKAPEEVKPPASSETKGSLKVTWNFARVRTSPWGSILGQLNRNETAEVTGQTKDSSGDTWYKVKYNGKDGYMHEDNVSFTAGKAPEEVKPPASSDKVTGSLKVTWDFARVRTSPWGSILGQLNRGQSADVIGQTKDSSGDTWYKVKYSGKDGYMHADNVSFSAVKPSEPDKPEAEKPQVKGSLRVNYSVLNVREKPTTSSKIVTSITDLTTHNYYEETRDARGDLWYKIDKGWVHGDYVDIGSQKVTDISLILSTLEYTGNPIDISAHAVGSSRALYKISLKQGSSYKVLSDFSEKNSVSFVPTAEGSYTIKVEARDIKASGIEKTFEESFTLKKNLSPHTVTYVDYGSLDAFAKSQVGRAVKWQDGYWVEASFEDIIREMDPQKALTFTLPQASPSSEQVIRITGAVNMRRGAGIDNSILRVAQPGEEFKLLDTTSVKGEPWYKVNYKGEDVWIHSDFAMDATALKPGYEVKLGDFVTIRSNGTPLKKTASTASETISYLAANSSYLVLDRSGSWMKVQHNGSEGWIQNAQASGTDAVNNNMYQFLDLRGNTGLSAQELNRVLEGKGILSGQGAAFVEASKLHNINEIYLVSHALLETGNGSSQLATGQLVQGTTVYNMYGIGAYDQDPVVLGAQAAYNNGWTTPEKAIIDGAGWIASGYVNNSDEQYTLYKMRYNYNNPQHQYATDISWAKAQTTQIKNLYGLVQGYNLRFEIPLYVYN